VSKPEPDDEMKDALMGRAQETAHVQARFSTLTGPGEASSQPEARAPAAPAAAPGATVPVPMHPAPRERVGTLLPSTEGWPWSMAAVMRFGAAGFALTAVVLLVLPQLRGSFQAPQAAELNQPTYKTIAPVLGTPAAPEDLAQTVTEQTASFDGAAILLVESEPESASVRVDGNDKGSTPASITLDCMPGKPIKVEVTRKGYESAQHLTFCRANTMIKLYARLRKAGKAAGSSD
jgi:hypothetical protein